MFRLFMTDKLARILEYSYVIFVYCAPWNHRTLNDHLSELSDNCISPVRLTWERWNLVQIFILADLSIASRSNIDVKLEYIFFSHLLCLFSLTWTLIISEQFWQSKLWETEKINSRPSAADFILIVCELCAVVHPLFNMCAQPQSRNLQIAADIRRDPQGQLFSLF